MQVILVIDADHDRLLETKEKLTDNFEVVIAHNREDTERILEEVLPDMIIVEYNEEIGFDTNYMKEIQEQPELCDIPFIFLSDTYNVKIESKCLTAGAAEFISRPFNDKKLLNRIKHSMEWQHRQRKLEIEVLRKVLEIEEQKAEVELQRALAESATKDPLTGLLSRESGLRKVNAILEKHCEGVFFMLDMDNFKAVNDTYGHIEGDKLLIRFAKTLEQEAGKDAIVGRIGGDEFFTFLPGKNSRKKVKEIAGRIVKSIERNIVSPGKLVRVTVSLGISTAPSDGENFVELYGRADKALYYVKKDGKNAYHFYGDTQSCTLSKKYTRVTLADITNNIGEKNIMNGSYMVDYDSFEKIYRFIERNVKRENRQVQCVLFTLFDENETIDNIDNMKSQMQVLEDAVCKTLRRGDVSTKYSMVQMLVLLMDVDEVNAIPVVNRIMRQYQEIADEDSMKLIYEIQPVKGDNIEIKEKNA